MNPAQKRLLNTIVHWLLVVSMVLATLAPVFPINAQESTETPTSDQPTTEPTGASVLEATEAPTVVVPEVTEAPTEVSTQTPSEATIEASVTPTVEVTEATSVPTQPPAETTFQDDFQDGNSDGWLFTGWEVIVEGDNSFLSASTPNATATIANVDWEHLLFAADFRVDTGSTASVSLRAGVDNYTVTLDEHGRVSLSRGGVVVVDWTPAAVPEATEPAPAVWRKLNIQALGGKIIVAVDGVMQIDHDDAAPLLGPGMIVFSSGAANTGTVAFDNVVIHKLEWIPETPVEPTVTAPEVTETVTPEVTETASPEVTETPTVVTPILSGDFEGDLSAWQTGLGASVVQESESNKALLLSPNSSLTPANTLMLADFQADLRFNIVSDAADGTPSGFSMMFHSQEEQTYILSVEAGAAALYRNGRDNVLANSPLPHTLNAWHSLNLNVTGGHIVVTIDGVVEIDFVDETPITHGQISFAANNASSVMLDDIAVTDLTPAELLASLLQTPMPMGITEENQVKLDGALYAILALYASGDQGGAAALADSMNIEILDEAFRVAVIVWAQEGVSGSDLAPAVEVAGGIELETRDTSVKAKVPLQGLIALVNAEQVFSIWPQPTIAVNGFASSGAASPAENPAGPTFSEGFDIVGAYPWHLASVTGSSAASIAVLDVGFNGVSSLAATERSCITSTTPSGGLGSGNHGTQVVQILCDIVPAASTVNMFTVDTTGNNLASQIASAASSNKIILIALDLGAHASPGDGTGGGIGEDFQGVYDAITNARLAGRVVIASAGNNGQSYRSYNDASITVNFTGVSNGDKVNVSWNSWGGTAAPSSISLNGGGTSYGGRPPGAPPSTQLTAGASTTALTINNSGGLLIQVQVVSASGNAIISGGTTPMVGTGSMGRPADSQDAIAVGAVCAAREPGIAPFDNGNYTIMPYSATGPVYGTLGSAPSATFPYIRDEVKPDLVAPAQVTTSLSPATSFTDCANGFGGTSAAAAHVAGIASLMVANTNASMSVFDGTDAAAVEAIQNYLQTHSADMPFGIVSPDQSGFDQTYGAGLAVLGNPAYDLTDVVNYLDAPDNIDVSTTCLGGFRYVGQANPADSLMDGTQIHPYASIMQGVSNAPVNGCVIVMPGEYGTPLYINGVTNNNVSVYAYDSAFFNDVEDSNFWTNNTYLDLDPVIGGAGDGGVYINNVNAFTLDGFVFQPATVFDTIVAHSPRAVVIDGGAGGTNAKVVRNNTINNFDRGITVQIVNSAQNAQIINNTFQGNTSFVNLAAVLSITGDSGTTNPVIVERNTFFNNTATTIGSINDWLPIVSIVNSQVHLRSNIFNANTGETVVRAQTPESPAGDAYELRVLGNIFLDNAMATGEPASGSGPVINIIEVPRFYFVNNTVVGHESINTTHGAIIGRGTSIDTLGGGGIEMHSNIFYNNDMPQGLFRDFQGAGAGCTSFAADGTVGANDGAWFNWIWNDGGLANPTANECNNSINNVGHSNITTVDPAPFFIGNDLDSIVEPTNPIFYALIPPAVTNPDPNTQNGIEDGRDVFHTAILAVGAPDPTDFLLDAAGKARRTDGDSNTVATIDIGAYELVVLRLINNPFTDAQHAGPFCEDGVSTGGCAGTALGVPFKIPLAANVEGGFGQLTFTIFQNPIQFGAQCGAAFSGTSGAIIALGNQAWYCPPQDFHTQVGEPGSTIPDNVTFQYSVRDEVGAEATGTITLTVDPSNDSLLISVIGDNNPSGDIFEVIANSNSQLAFRLRPSVSFGPIDGALNGNMVFSERNNNLEAALKTMVDYRYTYSDLRLQTTDNPTMFSGDIPVSGSCVAGGTPCVNPNSGVVHINFAALSGKGSATFHYDVTDARSSTTTDNVVTIRVVSIIPNRGLHDDTSLAFNFTSNWLPLYNTATINNTLHQASKANETGDFQFAGPGFVLYMNGDSTAGGAYQIRLQQNDGGAFIPLPTWVAGTNTGEFTTGTFQVGNTGSEENIVCFTRGTISNSPTAGRLINNKVGLYTVSCSGFDPAEVTTVQIINGEAKKVSVDAFSVSEDPDVEDSDLILGPGIHRIDEQALREFFDGSVWTEVVDAKANGGRARVTIVPDTLTFKFTGGTGFAIGTMLENKVKPMPTDTIGGQYEVCVVTLGGGDVPIASTEFCQNFDNGIGGTTAAIWKTFRPFFGFLPNARYQVTINVTTMQTGERMAIDSIIVFQEETGATPNAVLPEGSTEDDAKHLLIFGNGVDDVWTYDTNNVKASNKSLTSLVATATKAGPFVSFQVPNTTDTLIYQYVPAATTDSQNMMFCVNRPVGVNGDAGNCIAVNLRTGKYRQVLANGTFGAEIPTSIIPAAGSVIIQETLFRQPWGGVLPHNIEVFSLTNETFNFDRIQAIDTQSTSPLTAGLYEEIVPSLDYFQPNGTIGNTTFTSLVDVKASGGRVMSTSTLNEGLYFHFTGTGFSVRFTMDTKADAVKICWRTGDKSANTVNGVLTTGTCQIYDNQSATILNQAARTILGLEPGDYTVAVQMLDENFLPATHATAALPLAMKIDAVEIYNDPWFTSGNWNDTTLLNSLTTGIRYETSYVNRVVDNNFRYYGAGWKSLTGTLQSAKNYDQTSLITGAGVLFRTNGGDGLILYRDTKAGNAPVEVCVAAMNGGNTAVNLATRYCTTVFNDAGTGNQQPYGILFNTGAESTEHVVTITTLNNGIFVLDAVELVNTDAFDGAIAGSYRILGPGLYEEFNPALIYDRSFSSVLVNGDMERDANWTAVSIPPTSNTRFTTKYMGAFSRKFVATLTAQGIESTSFNLVSGQRYTIVARVQRTTGAVGNIEMQGTGTAVFTTVPADTNAALLNKWQTLRVDFVAGSSGAATLRFLSTGAGTFLVDDVSVVTGGQWVPIFSTTYSDKRMMESRTHGASMIFTFNGTGFEVGTLIDTKGGEVEICYLAGLPTATFAGADCFVYEHEATAVNPTTSRTVVGLTSGVHSVRVRDVEDGYITTVANTTTIRTAVNNISKVRVDYVRVFGDALPSVIPAGLYNENAVDGANNAFLKLLPAERWGSVTGTAANLFSGKSYVNNVNALAAASALYAGPVGVMQVNTDATIVLFSNAAVATNSGLLLVCVDDVNGTLDWTGATGFSLVSSTNCALLDAFKTSAQVVINQSITGLGVLGNPGTHVVTFRTLTPSNMKIDGYQVIYGTTLTAGYYEDTVGSTILQPLTGTWTTVKHASFSGGSALQSLSADASIEFEFTGTGFSLVTLMDNATGALGSNTLNIHLDNGAAVDLNGAAAGTDLQVSTFNATALYKAAVTVSGLPDDTYTVTLTEDYNGALLNKNKVVIDAIEVYGSLPLLGSLYDDVEVDATGTPLLAFGPSVNTWTVKAAPTATGFLNLTNHSSKTIGASVSFRVGDVSSIVLYTGKTSKAIVQVCWTTTPPTAFTRTCSPDLNTVSTTGNHLIVNPLDGTDTEYMVSIVSKSVNLDFFVDAVQTVLDGTLIEGIYQETYNDLTFNPVSDVANTLASDGKVRSLPFGGTLNFAMEGIGVSIVLVENTTTSGNYTVCVDRPGGGACDTVNQPLAKAATANGQTALTFVGLHTNAGGDDTFNVTITNNDASSKPLLIDRVEVLGAPDTSLQITTADKVENTAPQIQYFPFGSLTTLASTLASGGSQHFGKIPGSVIYFEFNGHSAEYVRQLSTTYGNVEVCIGRIDNGVADDCNSPVSNGGASAYQRGTIVDGTGMTCTDTEGCWVSIKALDNKGMPLDFVHLYDPTQPLEIGLYQVESTSIQQIRFFDSNLVLDAGSLDLPASTIADTTASGGQLKQTTTLREGMYFQFNGTGFAVLFKLESKADVVKICWRRGQHAAVNNVLDNVNATCQTFDNFSATAINQARRTILGLDEDIYTVVVQLLDENFTPLTHTTAQMPITMKLDAVEVYNDVWFTSGNWGDTANLGLLTPGTRYEPSYVNRAADNRFLYYGTGWKSVSGNAAYSGKNYDEVNLTGAGILFRTDGADAAIIYRNTGTGKPPMRVCVARMNVATTQVDFTTRYCTIVYNDGGTGTSQPFGLLFNTGGFNDEHVVTITTLGSGIFTLDAIELVNTDSFDGAINGTTYRILGPGLYEDSSPALVYDRVSDNLAVNGGMERDSDWVSVGNPATNVRHSVKYAGTYSRRIVTTTGNQGIESADFNVVAGQTYTIVARVFRVSGLAAMRIPSHINVVTDGSTATLNKWQTLRANFTATATETLNLQFVSEGTAQFYVDDVSINIGGTWVQVINTLATAKRMTEARTHGAQMTFSFIGTGFEIGTMVDLFGGEVEICYITGATTNFTGADCFTYQNQATAANSTTSRTVVGLPNGTYSVRVRDVEDGRTVLTKIPTDIRLLAQSQTKLRIDFVRIFGDALPPEATGGYYNENATDINGDRLLQLLPTNRWGSIIGTAANLFSFKSFVTVVDNAAKATTAFPGPVALLNIDVPSAQGVTVMVSTGAAATTNSSQVLVCADNVTGTVTWNGTVFSLANTTDCVLRSITAAGQIVVSATDLPALAVTGNHSLTFRSLTTGNFKIDTVQIIEGTILKPGIYDEFLPDTMLDFTPNVNPLTGCNPASQWCYFKKTTALGGNLVRTRLSTAKLVFTVEGTGFAVLSDISTVGVDMRICYKLASSSQPFPPGSATLDLDPDIEGGEPYCEKVSTNSTPTIWDVTQGNIGRPRPTAASQYGFAYYGLPYGQYTIEVLVNDSTIAITNFLQLDAIVVFDDPATLGPVMTAGLYDDTDPRLLYESAAAWTIKTYTTGPKTGAWKLGEHVATNAGSLVQMNVSGNALTVYQTTSTTGSKDVRICVVVTDDVVHCSKLSESLKAKQSSNFSQNGTVSYFTPIVFYGIGDGSHRVIFENRDHGKGLSIDAIRPWD